MSQSFQSPEMQHLQDLEHGLSYQLMRPLQFEVIKQGVAFPFKEDNTGQLSAGIMREDKTFCDLAKTKRISPRNFDVWLDDWFVDPLHSLNLDAIPFVNKDVIFLGALPDHYGHFITEGISRLWPYLDKEKKNLSSIYFSENNHPPFVEFLNLFGLQNSQINRVDTPLRFKSILVPEQSIRLHDFYHESYNESIEKILDNIDSIQPEKIFLSKKAAKYLNGKSIGENSIEKIFSDNNYTIIYPETLSIREFLSTMKSASSVTALSGSSAHNAIFMKKKSSLICMNRSNHHHPLQIMINEMRQLNVTYVDVFLNFFKVNFGNGPFNIIISKYFIDFAHAFDLSIGSKSKIFFKTSISTIQYLIYATFLGKLLYYLGLIANKKKKILIFISFLFLFMLLNFLIRIK
jgi:hypothetical protein